MRALKLILAIAGVLLLAAWTWPAAEFSTAPVGKVSHYTDKRLYHDIAAEVAAGRPYYAAAAELQRAHGYPLRPGFTVRPPTLVVAAARLGWKALQQAAYALAALTAAAWFFALRRRAHWGEALVAAALIAGGATMLAGHPVILHERWAGLLLALALALRLGWREAWPASLGATAVAMAMRELAVPFALLSLAAALRERRWRETAGWAGLLGLWAMAMALHMHEVSLQIRPGDLSTQGWTAAMGPAAAVRAIILTSPLQYVPSELAVPLAILPLLGWLGLGGREGRFCLVLLGGYALMIALFARPDNFYWGAIVQPAWFAGLAFLPRLVVTGWRYALDKRTSAPNLASTGARL